MVFPEDSAVPLFKILVNNFYQDFECLLCVIKDDLQKQKKKKKKH